MTPHDIALLGFTSFERSTFESFFRLAARREPGYRLSDDMTGATLIVANADDPDTLHLLVDRRPGQPVLCGFICSAVQLMAGVSGPLLDVFFVRSRLDRKGVVATKAITQSFGHLVKIVYFGGVAVFLSAASKGAIQNSLSIFLAVTCVVLAFTGTTLSRRVLEKMTDADFRRWTQWTVMTLGVVNLATGVYLLASGAR